MLRALTRLNARSSSGRTKSSLCRLSTSCSDTKDKLGYARVHSALPNGCLDYARSWAWQHVILSRRLAAMRKEIFDPQDHTDCILLLEHSPVYTLGRGADEQHLKFLEEEKDEHKDSRRKLSRKSRGKGTARLAVDRSTQAIDLGQPLAQAVDELSHIANPVISPNGVPIYRVERGGEVTFHGPSQLVVYPLFNLQEKPFEKDLHWYLRMIEEVVIQTLAHYGIEGIRDDENTGVWVGEDKIAAVGISSSRWITTHGFAINIDPDLEFFDTSVILPCGIQGKGVTSMAQVLEKSGLPSPTIEDVSDVVVGIIADVFDLHLENGMDLL